jgi:glutathione peroxidase
MQKQNRLILVLLLIAVIFVCYVEIVNRNTRNMTYRQKVLKAVYPALMWWTKLRGKNAAELSQGKTPPPVPFYSLKATLNNGQLLDFSSLKGKKILLVNTASNCGYTDQYKELEELYEANKDKLVIIGFPANDFKEQEKGTDEEIAQFCQTNYGITFPLVKKSTVIKSGEQNEVFRWLTDPAQNGWNDKPPSWNFSKYLVNEEGILTNYFGPSISPTSGDVMIAINQK